MNLSPLRMAGFVARVGVAVLRRPHLVGTAIRQMRALAPERWWATGSHLPLPSSDYLAFRQVTLSGDPDSVPSVHDVIIWLEWCRSMNALPARTS